METRLTSQMLLTNPKSHPLWKEFVTYVTKEDVPIYLDDPCDWLDYWKCFLAGAQVGRQLERRREE